MQTQSQKSYARIIGLIYLLIAFCGPFSIGYVPATIIADTGAQTILNLHEHNSLFHAGMFADILTFLLEIGATTMLYIFFKRYNETLATAAAFARIGMSIIMGINLLFYMAPLFLINNQEVINAYSPEQLQGLVQLFFDIHAKGILVWGLFFGVHLLLLAPLVLKSGLIPKWIGWFMLIGSIGYIYESVVKLILPPNDILSVISAILLAVVTIGELSFTFFLLIKGVKEKK